MAAVSTEAFAQGSAAKLSDGNTAWILTATALVLFMTLPGLALFYGGLVRSRNVLSVLMHCFAICCLASVLWLVGVYSLAFSVGGALGTLLAAFFAATSLGGLGLADGVSMGRAFWVQLVGVAATLAWTVVVTYVIIKAVGAMVGLRVSEDDETEGLNITAHGERGYNL